MKQPLPTLIDWFDQIVNTFRRSKTAEYKFFAIQNLELKEINRVCSLMVIVLIAVKFESTIFWCRDPALQSIFLQSGNTELLLATRSF